MKKRNILGMIALFMALTITGCGSQTSVANTNNLTRNTNEFSFNGEYYVKQDIEILTIEAKEDETIQLYYQAEPINGDVLLTLKQSTGEEVELLDTETTNEMISSIEVKKGVNKMELKSVGKDAECKVTMRGVNYNDEKIIDIKI